MFFNPSRMFRLYDILFLGVCLITHFYFRFRHRPRLPFPPGPKRWPLAGNAFSIPTSFAYEYYNILAKKFSKRTSLVQEVIWYLGSIVDTNILYLEAFGRPIVVLNDLKTAQDLLDKRSAIYSGRLVLVSTLVQLPFTHHTDLLRRWCMICEI